MHAHATMHMRAPMQQAAQPMHQQAPFSPAPAPFAQAPSTPQTPFAPQTQGWGAPYPRGPTFKKKYDPAPSFTGAPLGTTQRGGSTVKGYEREVLDWLELFGDALADHDLGPAKVVMLLAMQLRGSAKTWYQDLKAKDSGHEAFKGVKGWLAAVREKFTDPNVKLQAMATLKELKQTSGNHGLRNYIKTFNECVEVLGAEEDSRVKYDFVRGLQPKYKDRCLMAEYLRPDPMTLPDLQKMLEGYELTMHDSAAYYPGYQPRNTGGQHNRHDPMELGATQMGPHGNDRRGNYKGGRGRFNGGRNGGGKPRGPPEGLDHATYEERLDQRLCFICGESGHRAYQCPQKKEAGNEKSAQK